VSSLDARIRRTCAVCCRGIRKTNNLINFVSAGGEMLHNNRSGNTSAAAVLHRGSRAAHLLRERKFQE